MRHRRQALSVRLTSFLLVLFFMGLNSVLAQDNIKQAVDKFGNHLLIQENPKTGSAHRVYGARVNIARYGFTVHRLNALSFGSLSERLLADYGDILKISPSDMKFVKCETDGEMWFVSYTQSINGIPVYGTEIGYSIDKRGDIVSLGADVYTKKVEVTSTPKMAKDAAISVAKRVLKTEAPMVKSGPDLVVYPKEDHGSVVLFLAWKMELASLPTIDVLCFVDAANGALLGVVDNICDYNVHGTIKASMYPNGVYNPSGTAPVPITGMVMYDRMGARITETSTDANGNYSLTFNKAYGYYYIYVPLRNTWALCLRGNNDDVLWAGAFGFTSGAYVQCDYTTPLTDDSNLLYHVTLIHNFFAGAPFNCTSMNYQMKIRRYEDNPDVNASSDGTDILFGTQMAKNGLARGMLFTMNIPTLPCSTSTGRSSGMQWMRAWRTIFHVAISTTLCMVKTLKAPDTCRTP